MPCEVDFLDPIILIVWNYLTIFAMLSPDTAMPRMPTINSISSIAVAQGLARSTDLVGRLEFAELHEPDGINNDVDNVTLGQPVHHVDRE